MEKLIRKCVQKDRKAQEHLYQLFSGKLYAICLKYSRSQIEAQDNLQDSFVTIFNKIKDYRFKGSFEGWLKRVTINTVLQKYRKEYMVELVSEDIEEEVTIDVDKDRDVSLEYLLQIIQDLPDKYRLIFSLYVLDGYSHKEIASMLNISIGTSKSNLFRAKKILKNNIESIFNQTKVNFL